MSGVLPSKKKSPTQFCSHLNAVFVLLYTFSPFMCASHLSSLNMPFPFHIPSGIALPPMQALFPFPTAKNFVFSLSCSLYRIYLPLKFTFVSYSILAFPQLYFKRGRIWVCFMVVSFLRWMCTMELP